MKIVYSAVVLLIAFAFGAHERSAPTEYYYFCDSRPVSAASGSKQLILYTPVKKIVCEPDAFARLSQRWGDKVIEVRRGGPAGYSDLNYYRRQAFADSVLEGIKHYYSDTSKYLVRVIP
jgi:hypothetical protein